MAKLLTLLSMPELPEVETIKRELEAIITGKKIVEISVRNPAVIRQPSVDGFKKNLAGVIVKKILRKAKMLVFELSNGKSLLIHLKMTGQLIYPGSNKNSRVSFLFSDGKWLDFNDQRLFGELRLMEDWHCLKFIQELGHEPFDIKFDAFDKMVSEKKTKIKPLLMDQSFIAGIGNLYAAEILFRSRIHPERPANSLSDSEKKLLFKEINEVLNEAIRYGGSSVDDYVRVSGKKGDYQAQHRVYGKENQPCPGPNCKALIKKINLGGRGTYFCDKCQK